MTLRYYPQGLDMIAALMVVRAQRDAKMELHAWDPVTGNPVTHGLISDAQEWLMLNERDWIEVLTSNKQGEEEWTPMGVTQ